MALGLGRSIFIPRELVNTGLGRRKGNVNVIDRELFGRSTPPQQLKGGGGGRLRDDFTVFHGVSQREKRAPGRKRGGGGRAGAPRQYYKRPFKKETAIGPDDYSQISIGLTPHTD